MERVLPELAPFVRRRVLKSVALARRSALAARLMPLVRSRHGDEEAAILLSTLDAPEVSRLLPELEHAVRNWDALVRLHPHAVLHHLRSRLSQAPERERGLLLYSYHGILAQLSLEHSEAVLALVRDFSPPDQLPPFAKGSLRRLIRRHPAQVAELLLRPEYRPTLLRQGFSHGVLREMRAFSPEHRLALARALAESPRHLTDFLHALPPSQRAAPFAAAFEGTPPRAHPEALLAVLPHAVRDAEATRQLGLREVRDDKDQQLVLHALRTLEHGREPLQKAATAPKAEDRARALTLLVTATARSRRGLTETLAFLSRLKNEQDPVRQAALSALAAVPPSLFTAEHIPALQFLVTSVVEARDTSLGTQGALQNLAFRQLTAHATAPEHPLFRFALETLQRLAGQSGTLALPRLDRDLPRGTEHALVAALLPLIRSAQKRESHGLILTLTRALRRRAWNVDMLQALLEPITQAKPDPVAQTAISLWLEPPRTRDVRVRKLLERDESTVTLASVFEHLHKRRQELLDPYLQGRPLRGHYSTGKTGWVPPASSGFERWVPRQQRLLAQVLLRIARDAERSAWERASVIRGLARMPTVDVDTLRPFLADPSVNMVEAVLGAIAWLDRPEPGLPMLLESLDGDRARVAMYAIPRVARRSSPEAFSTVLGSLLARERLKVTVHKEVLRLLATFRTPRSVALLREQWDRPTLHRDVRIAVGHAARRLLDDPAAWSLLEAMAQSPDEDVATSLLDQGPLGLRVEHRARYASLILQVSRHPAVPARQRAFATLASWATGLEAPVARETAARVVDLTSGPEWRQALATLVTITQEGLAFEEVVACAAQLTAAPPTPDATPERDQPALQRVKALARGLLDWSQPVRLRMHSRLDEVAHVLARQEVLWPESAALRMAGLDWRDPASATTRLLELGREVREEPLFAPSLAATVGSAVEHPGTGSTPEALLEIAAGVASELPLVALTLVTTAGRRLHWREDAAALLRSLRQHPRAALRAAALAVVTAQE